MKKVLLIAIVLMMLCACQKSDEDKLLELGYQEEDIVSIMGLSEELREVFLQEYDERYVEIINTTGFDEKKFDKYLSNYGLMENEIIVKLINENKLTRNNMNKLKELYDNEYYVAELEDIYLHYLDSYGSIRDMIEIVNTKRYLELYSDIETADLSKGYLVLVNKYYKLPSDYEPDDLVEVSEYYGGGFLRSEVYKAYQELYEDAYANGYDLRTVSTYRSYDYQDGLYNKYLSVDSQENVDTYSARPGHSEHQSGLCLDVSVPGYGLDDFYLTDASSWLAQNCYKYGFIIRYTEEKVNITGYQAEPWQIRYVGKDAAKDIYSRGITLDEYYTCFVK